MNNSVIGKEESKALKGFLSILVVLCHCRSYLHIIDVNEIARQVFIAFGYISVGVFFFLSGYGVYESYANNQEYMQTFPRNRILSLYLKYILLVAGYAILLYAGGTLKTDTIVPSFFVWGGVTTVVNGWYFQIAILLYVLFWVIYTTKYTENGKFIAYIIAIIIYTSVCVITKTPSHLYQTVFLFVAGLYVSRYKGSLVVRIWSDRPVYILGVVAFSILLFFKNKIQLGPISNIVYMTIMATILTMSLLGSRFPTLINRFCFRFVGEISLELYGVHGAIITILRNSKFYIQSDALFLILLFVMSVVVAWITHNVFFKMDKLIRK